jgi:hypothetical protein
LIDLKTIEYPYHSTKDTRERFADAANVHLATTKVYPSQNDADVARDRRARRTLGVHFYSSLLCVRRIRTVIASSPLKRTRAPRTTVNRGNAQLRTYDVSRDAANAAGARAQLTRNFDARSFVAFIGALSRHGVSRERC